MDCRVLRLFSAVGCGSRAAEVFRLRQSRREFAAAFFDEPPRRHPCAGKRFRLVGGAPHGVASGP
eukprot:11163413-Lingulodinium_polyedra.AAC.1